MALVSLLLWLAPSLAADGRAWLASKTPASLAAEACPAVPRGLVDEGAHLRRIHFVHVPKSAGSSFARAVRHAACLLNNGTAATLGCCARGGPEQQNGFCRASCAPPPCGLVLGCDYCGCRGGRARFQASRLALAPSVTIVRHPMARLVSSFFIGAAPGAAGSRGVHEAFGVAGASRAPAHAGSFAEYVERPENVNVLVKMFARNASAHEAPRGGPLVWEDFKVARRTLAKFELVALSEMFGLAVRALFAQLGVDARVAPSKIEDTRSRAAFNADTRALSQLRLRPTASRAHKDALQASLRADDALVRRIYELNSLDITLFKTLRMKFCQTLNAHGLGDHADASICHRPVEKLNGLQDAQCPAEPAEIERARYPQVRWTTAHFVHVPKSGGSSFGRAVRRALCAANAFSAALDCCIADEDTWCNQGCPQPDCGALFGCRYCDCRHTPQLGYMDRSASVTILRHPSDRAVSGYFFRGHSPNWDRFGVRKEFPRDPGKWPYSFDSYLDMPEYHNIATRMLGCNSFPYTNLTVTRAALALAKRNLAAFRVIGLNEAYEASVHVLARAYGVDDGGFGAGGAGGGAYRANLSYAQLVGEDAQDASQPLKASSHRNKYDAFRAQLARDGALAARVAERNAIDIELFRCSPAALIARARELLSRRRAA